MPIKRKYIKILGQVIRKNDLERLILIGTVPSKTSEERKMGMEKSHHEKPYEFTMLQTT